jgi:hypothetical protein
MAIFRLFDANENGKQMFVFLGWQTKNGNRLLLFQQTCLSMVVYYYNMGLHPMRLLTSDEAVDKNKKGVPSKNLKG